MSRRASGKIKKYTSFLCAILSLASVGGVFATWSYATPLSEINADLSVYMNEFVYLPDMPKGEAMLLQRLFDILNREYTVEGVEDVRAYLLEETIKVQWEAWAAPYVGNMDDDYAVQIHALFGDILDELNVSFILKNQDLNADGFNEIALYSTSDPLNYIPNTDEIVGVYLSVLTPVVDEQKNVVAYELVCDSMYGFCYEEAYNPMKPTLSSFSTDDWRDNLVYWHHELDTQPIPDDAIGFDGQTLYKYHYDSYHSKKYTYEGYPWGYTGVWIEGKTAAQMLNGKIPFID